MNTTLDGCNFKAVYIFKNSDIFQMEKIDFRGRKVFLKISPSLTVGPSKVLSTKKLKTVHEKKKNLGLCVRYKIMVVRRTRETFLSPVLGQKWETWLDVRRRRGRAKPQVVYNGTTVNNPPGCNRERIPVFPLSLFMRKYDNLQRAWFRTYNNKQYRVSRN